MPVSFQQVSDPNVERPRADRDREYLRPRLEEGFVLPRYPDDALAAEAPATDVVVRMVIAKDGSVASVEPSPLAAPPATEWELYFHRVVGETVGGWRYDPCQIRRFEDGPDRDGDGAPDYRVLASTTPIEVYLDIKFKFEIIDGAGRVSTDAEGDG